MAGTSGVAEREAEIFDGVFFAVVPSAGFSHEHAAEITETLELYGATHCALGSNKLSHITHLISTTADFPAYHDAVDGFIHVVKPSWVEQSVVKRRAANPRQYSPDPQLFLSDVVVFCADDIPPGDKDAIVAGVQALGGLYSAVMTKLVTHVVALTMDNNPCRLVVDKNLKCKPVLPHWFDACLKLRKKIDHSPYLLPNPPILSKPGSPGPARFSNPDLEGATQLEPDAILQHSIPSASPSKDVRDLSVFKNRNIMLHNDLRLSGHLKSSLSDLIEKGGGRVVTAIEDATQLVCHGRESSEFQTASRDGKDVGNLNWLYHLIKHNAWTSPTRRLLHYPYPEGGLAGFENFKISVSNYTGDARVYLETLVRAAGGTFTKSMMQENTHLITAHTFSEKCTAANEWNIKMVNHLWLEESYARCEVQAVTNARYTTFPEKTNLGEVVGQTQIDRKAVEMRHFPPRDSSEQRREQLEPIELNSSASRTPLQKSVSKKKALQTPATLLNGTAKETPGGSRGAKDRALNKLHSMADDIALYAKETKRVGGVVYGGRRVNDPDRITITRKRNSGDEGHSTEPSDCSEEDSETSPVAKKRQKQSKSAAPAGPTIKVLLTGWDPKLAPTLKANARAFKISFTDDPTSRFDVLVAPKILRTRKFLSAIANAPTFVDVSWLTDTISHKERPPIAEYPLKDPEGERGIDLTLPEIARRAKANKEKGGMLRGRTIFCTERVNGGFEAYEEIVRANGGQCLLFKGRETTVKRRTTRTQAEDEEMDRDMSSLEEKEALHLITDTETKPLWTKFRAMAESQGFVPRICKPDWMLRIAMSQDVEEWQDEWEWSDADE